MTMPLHPRRAHQLFQEVLLADSELTPHTTEKSLPERLHILQTLNLSGVHEAKRGTGFQCIRAATVLNSHVKSEEVTLKLTKDGSSLQLATETHTGILTVKLIDVKGIALYDTPQHSFSFQLGDQNIGGDNNIPITDIFVASDADMLNRWVTALTCGVNAFQDKPNDFQGKPNVPDAKNADLVWQAVRLRIFELAEVMPLPTAIEHVTNIMPDRDYQQSDVLLRRVQFLQRRASI